MKIFQLWLKVKKFTILLKIALLENSKYLCRYCIWMLKRNWIGWSCSWYLYGAQLSTLERIVNLPHKAAIKLCQKLRTCCSSWWNRNPTVIGGNGLNYFPQIDESQLHYRQRVNIC